VTASSADGVARVVLARPEAGNSFDLEAARALAATLAAADADPSCRTIVLTADGPVFSAGGDIGAMVRSADAPAYLDALVRELSRSTMILAATRASVVCVLDGAVAGAGALFPLLSDYVIATDAAFFVSGYATVGLSPDCGVSYLLPRAVGERRALRLSLGGERLDARTAKEWGLIDEIAAPSELDARVAATVERFGRSSPAAAAPARRLIRDLDGLAGHLDREREEIVALAGGPDTQGRLERFAARA
jgi:2-(1,2-epoxy-1,2-dihydrophenyl)acetyl-CoA isomerase